jgi:hypothetical protein
VSYDKTKALLEKVRNNEVQPVARSPYLVKYGLTKRFNVREKIKTRL